MAENSKYVYVRNNESRVRGMAFRQGALAAGGEIDPKAIVMAVHGHITLKPGVNRFLTTEVEPVKASILELTKIVTPESRGLPVLELIPASQFEGAGEAAVGQVFDVELLKTMLVEASPSMVPHIQAQLKRILPPAEGVEGAPIVPEMAPEYARQRATGKRA